MTLAGFPWVQVTTPQILLLSHNNFYRGSKLQSTLFIWSPFFYGLIRLKLLAYNL
jgi:hypothetical protein